METVVAAEDSADRAGVDLVGQGVRADFQEDQVAADSVGGQVADLTEMTAVEAVAPIFQLQD